VPISFFTDTGSLRQRVLLNISSDRQERRCTTTVRKWIKKISLFPDAVPGFLIVDDMSGNYRDLIPFW
jgi:hypothetical protein